MLRAEVLSEALPYILKYRDKIIVVKYGGNAMINEDLKKHVMEDLVMLRSVGMKVVLVHGGGPEIRRGGRKVPRHVLRLLEPAQRAAQLREAQHDGPVRADSRQGARRLHRSREVHRGGKEDAWS